MSVWGLSVFIFSQGNTGRPATADHKAGGSISETQENPEEETSVPVRSITDPRYTLAVNWGSNFYGNTFEISLNRSIRSHFSVGLNMAFGGIKYTLPGNGTKFNISNAFAEDIDNKIKIHYIFDASIFWHRKKDKRLILFNTFGIGVGRYSITLTQTAVDDDFPGVYEGAEDYSRFALFVTTHLFEYRQKKLPYFGITLGAKANLSRMKLPQSITLYNEHHFKIVTHDGTGYYVIPYVEGFVRFSVSF